MEKSSFAQEFAPEESGGSSRRIDPTTLSREQFLVVDETVRAFNASHAIVQQDVAPLWKAANRSLVASTLVGAGVFQTAKKFAAGKPNVPIVVAGISWILAYRVTNFFYRKDVLENLLNGETKLSHSLRTALEQGQPQYPPAFVQSRAKLSQEPAPVSETVEQPPSAFSNEEERNTQPALISADRPRVNLLQGVNRPTDESGQRKLVTWDDIRARQNNDGEK